MLVYVETNFALEFARQQQQAPAVETILALAEGGSVELKFPAFCVGEIASNLRLRRAERNTTKNILDRSVNELRRTDAHAALAQSLQDLTVSLVAISSQEEGRAFEISNRLLAVASLLPLNQDIFRASRGHVAMHGLEWPDALVYASILDDVQRQPAEAPKLFLSRDNKAFGTASLTNELRSYACDYMNSFVGAAARITHISGNDNPA